MTPLYRAPECTLASTHRGELYEKSIDIWSLGCIFFEMETLSTFIQCPKPPTGATKPKVDILMLTAICARLGLPPSGVLQDKYTAGLVRQMPAAIPGRLLKQVADQADKGRRLLQMCLLCLHWLPEDRISAPGLVTQLQAAIANTRQQQQPVVSSALVVAEAGAGEISHGFSQASHTGPMEDAEMNTSGPGLLLLCVHVRAQTAG